MAGWRQRDLGGAGAGFGGAGAGLGRRLAVAGAEGGGFLRFFVFSFSLFLAPFPVTRAAGGLFLCGARAAK